MLPSSYFSSGLVGHRIHFVLSLVAEADNHAARRCQGFLFSYPVSFHLISCFSSPVFLASAATAAAAAAAVCSLTDTSTPSNGKIDERTNALCQILTTAVGHLPPSPSTTYRFSSTVTCECCPPPPPPSPIVTLPNPLCPLQCSDFALFER